MKGALVAVCAAMLTLAPPVYWQEEAARNYSQKVLLKNWALSRCLGLVSNGKAAEDANSSATAYLEFGRQRVEVYEALSGIVTKWIQKKYAGSVRSEFNTMKCIDLFHSKELDVVSSKYSS